VAEGARMKIPYMLVLGRREAETETVAVNVRGAGREQKPLVVPVDAFVGRIEAERDARSLVLSAGASS